MFSANFFWTPNFCSTQIFFAPQNFFRQKFCSHQIFNLKFFRQHAASIYGFVRQSVKKNFKVQYLLNGSSDLYEI